MLALAALVLTQTSVAVAAEQVDLLLVLSSDVSRSVDHPKFLLQREGYATAISDPHVIDAIRSGPTSADRGELRRMVGLRRAEARDRLTVIDGPAAARNSATNCSNCRARSPTAPRSAAASNSQWRN
jgi:hypothetical protein